jgi:hypothetical protein
MKIVRIAELLTIYIAIAFFVLMAFTYRNSPPNVEGWTYEDFYNAQVICTIRYLIIVTAYIIISGLLFWRILKPNKTLRIVCFMAILIGSLITWYFYFD